MIQLAGLEYNEQDLIERVLMNIRRVKQGSTYGQYRWAKVSKVFGIGSASAKAMCVRFGFDPDERVCK